MNICVQCDKPTNRGLRSKRCRSCWLVHARLVSYAHNYVSKAVADGKIASLKMQEIPCIDCGSRAKYYDHRDYRKPLEVEPVCMSCNCKRGTTERLPDEVFSVLPAKYQ